MGDRRRDDGQLRPEPPVDARRAATGRRPLRRGRDRSRGRDRLPAHGLREDDGAEDVVEVHHVSGAHRLRLLPEQRVRLRRRGREAARPRDPAEGDVDAHRPLRAEPDPQPPRVARHLGPRTRCDLDVLVRVPRAGPDPRPVRAGHRLPHAHPVLPGRRPRRGHPARLLPRGAQVLRVDASRDRRLRDAAHSQQDLARAHRGARAPVGRRRDRAGPVGPGAARVGGRLGPPQDTAVPRLPPGRLRRPGLPSGRRVCALPRAHGGDAAVGAHRRAVSRPAGEHGGRAVDRGRPQGRASAARRAPHLHGVADPPLQDRHRGVQRPRGRGLYRDRVAAWRARLLCVLRRRPEAVARQVPRSLLRRAPGDRHVHDRRADRRHDRDRRLARHRDGRGGSVSVGSTELTQERSRRLGRRRSGDS